MVQKRLNPETPPIDPVRSPSDRSLADRLILAPNVQLIGELQGSGFAERQWLVQRNGRYLQVTELLYDILQLAGRGQTIAEIADGVNASTEWIVTPAQIRQLVETRLVPLGLVAGPDGSVVPTIDKDRPRQTRSPLAVNLPARTVGPEAIEPISRVLQALYTPPILAAILLLAITAHVWLYFVHGVIGSIYAVLLQPELLILVIPVVLAAGVFHELGHAAALHYGGGRVRTMGVGFYLIYPTFYTDVTDAYRLGRRARLRTDLGGIYFHLIFVLAILVVAVVTKLDFLLSVAVLVDLDILYQCIPWVRLDGYWALSDLLGIPDLFSQTVPFLRSLLPGRLFSANRLPPLKPWVKAAFGLYLVVAIPIIAFVFFQIVANAPAVLITVWGSIQSLVDQLTSMRSGGSLAGVASSGAEIFVLSLSALGVAYFVINLFARPLLALWRWSKPVPTRRLVAALGTLGLIGVLAVLWSPWLPVPRPAAPPGVQTFEVTQRAHVDFPVVYAQNPPVGGNHWPVWLNCGFYATPVRPEYAAHSLEHGAVWITYRSDLAQSDVETLHHLASQTSYVIVSPYPGLPATVVASAWGSQLKLESAADPRLSQFVATFRLGPQAPERGGPCSGGVGSSG